MALQILDVDGDSVYVGGYIDLKFTDPNTLEVTGLDVNQNETYEVEADQAAAQGHPGFGAGNLLYFICEKIKEVLCKNCN